MNSTRENRRAPSRLSVFHGAAIGSFLAASAAMFSGCGSLSTATGGSPSELHLFAVPAAIRLDNRPVPDGIGVRIYASAQGKAQGIPLKSGRLEIWMYDGTIVPSKLAEAKPLRIWTFSSAELEPFAATTTLGEGYQMALRWDDKVPKSKVVTVVARFRPVRGQDLVSTANTIAVSVR